MVAKNGRLNHKEPRKRGPSREEEKKGGIGYFIEQSYQYCLLIVQ